MSMSVQPGVSVETPRASELCSSLFSGALADRFPVYEELRELGDGIHWAEEAQGYVVTRYEDVRQIGSEPGTFSSDVFWQTPQAIHDPDDSEQLRFVTLASPIFMFSDPPVHTRIRSIFRHAFTPAAIEAWRPMVEDVTRELMQSYQVGDDFDIMPGFAADVPVAIIAAILGVPAEKRSLFRKWSTAYSSTFDPIVQGQRRAAEIATSLELMDYLGGLVAQRRAEPQKDLITLLVQTQTSRGDYLEDAELLSQLTLLLAAGNETTTNLIGSGLTLLFDNPEAQQELVQNPGLLPAAIEEMLRCDPPLHFMFRKTTRQTRLGDHDLPAGVFLLPCPPAANRDPRRFPNPGAFDIKRPDNKHLSFFHGVHFCVGAPLARLEAAVVFREILKNYPGIGPGRDVAQRRSENSTIGGWETRPVRL